jgi:hypothetical protein
VTSAAKDFGEILGVASTARTVGNYSKGHLGHHVRLAFAIELQDLGSELTPKGHEHA